MNAPRAGCFRSAAPIARAAARFLLPPGPGTRTAVQKARENPRRDLRALRTGTDRR